MNLNNPKLITIVGETATGKSGLAMEIARRFDGEIINADSWAIYKELDIGTAKPSLEERAEIPHHLVDIINPNEDFSAAVYKDLATQAITDIASRGKLPVLVGGTGLYVDSVLFDYSFMPPGKIGQREELNSKTIDELLTMLQQKRIDTTGIDIRNKRRLIRLLETGGARPDSSELRQNTLVIGLSIPRAKLRENVEKRVEVMFRRGLKHEVRELSSRYGWEIEAMKGIGYREFKEYFEDQQSLAETKRKIVKHTLGRLAKPQRTWFKRNRQIVWVDSREEAIKISEGFML